MKKKLTTTSVAAMLGVSDQSVANWIDQGQLKAGRTPGGHRRIEKEDLIDFLRRQKLKIPQELSPGPRKILIVDDEESICQWLSDALGQQLSDCQILSASDGYSAGEIVATEQPEIILLDLYMPGMDGFEVCKRIKGGPRGYQCSVIAMTAHMSQQATQTITEAGALTCISKPIDIKALCALVASCMADIA